MSVTSTQGLAVLERLSQHFKDLLLKRDQTLYDSLLLEARISLSGILLKTPYARFLEDPDRLQQIQQTAQRLHVRLYSEAEIEQVRLVWERNIDQVRSEKKKHRIFLELPF